MGFNSGFKGLSDVSQGIFASFCKVEVS